MKKMIFVAVALLASLSQAGTINWNVTAIRDPSGGLTITSSDQVYIALIFTDQTGSSTGWQTTGTFPNNTYNPGSYTYGKLSDLDMVRNSNQSQISVASGQGSIPSGASGANILDQQWAEDNRAANNLLTFYVVMFYNAAGSASEGNATHYAVSNLYNLDVQNIHAADAKLDMTGLFQQVGWQPVVPIPEPATMALVGIGIAALGLRRRRK